MALRPFCLILQYSYPLSCSRWRAVGVQPASQPGSLPTVRLVFPEPDFGRNINPALRRTWTHTRTHSPLRRCRATTGEGHEDQFPRPRPSGRYLFRKRSLCCRRIGHLGFWVSPRATKLL